MPTLKNVRIVLTFYRKFFWATSLITLCCMVIFYTYGLETFFVIFWFKVITLALVLYFVNTFNNKDFFYYQNLGLSKVRLWTITFSLDFILFILSLVIIYHIR